MSKKGFLILNFNYSNDNHPIPNHKHNHDIIPLAFSQLKVITVILHEAHYRVVQHKYVP